MEIALHEIYTKVITTDQRPGFKLIHEYPLSGKPPMMTHILKIKPKNYCSQRWFLKPLWLFQNYLKG
jgi:hypothetical protein